jgi:hypothetical protein
MFVISSRAKITFSIGSPCCDFAIAGASSSRWSAAPRPPRALSAYMDQRCQSIR